MVWSLLWAIVIASLYFLPGKDMPVLSFWDILQFDKVGHFGVFAVLSVITLTGLKRQQQFRRMRVKAVALMLTFIIPYAALLEYFQGILSPDRTSDVMDFLANVGGSLIGIVIFKLIYRGC